MSEKLLSYENIEAALEVAIKKAANGLEKRRLESALEILKLSASLVAQRDEESREEIENRIYEILS